MSPEAQRIAIAKACGWTDVQVESVGAPAHSWTLCGSREGAFSRLVPDYLNDLNAMHEAEKVLIRSESEDYWDEVAKLIPNFHGMFGVIHATATQRAEAFLRTLNLWTETPADSAKEGAREG